jgi:hypothetical protein
VFMFLEIVLGWVGDEWMDCVETRTPGTSVRLFLGPGA